MELKVIRLPEKFNYSYHKAFIEECNSILLGGITQVELDFSRVEYLDSAALGMLVLLHKKIQGKNVRVFIKGAREAAENVLQMANMQKLFEFV